MSAETLIPDARGASPFSRGAVLAVVLVGFAAFIAMLYFISAGDTGNNNRSGAAHASANGLNGYSGLVRLLEAEGIEVERTRRREDLTTSDLLILTPSRSTDIDEFSQILLNRQFNGPTLVILPKWIAGEPRGEIADEDQLRLRDDWVQLFGPMPVLWSEELPDPFAFSYGHGEARTDRARGWTGFGRSGRLPTQIVFYSQPDPSHEPLVRDAAGNNLAIKMAGGDDEEFYEDIHTVTFVIEPDLLNNYGLADGQRAGLALDLVRDAGYGDVGQVTFDMTLNGFGQSMNLLTLAFRPPFLAATLCLILAMVIIGWRAFLRFGPTAVSGQAIAFGKQRLVSNGAGLIVRAGRLNLLADPYAALITRRVGRSLGLAHPDPVAIDAALAQRMPEHEPFSNLAARLHNARGPSEILRAAKDLSALSQSLTGKTTR